MSFDVEVVGRSSPVIVVQKVWHGGSFLGSFSYVKEEKRMPAACSSETVAVVIVGSKNGRVF